MNFLTRNIRKISLFLFAAVVITLLIFSGWGKPFKHSLFRFDTLIDINLSGKNAKKAAEEIELTLTDLEKTYSKYRSDSLIQKFNSMPETESMIITDEIAGLISRCKSISETTGGAFDITTSKLSDLWQIKTATTPPNEQDIATALAHTGYNKISLSKNTLTKTDADIDFGGVLKGFAADKVRDVAARHGIKSGIVNLGGNVCLIGAKDGGPWTVGIANPFSPSEVYLTVQAENTNVITSGAYQRYFEHCGEIYHHILSPQTGRPAESDVASATVISTDGTLADALSTAIFVQGSENGLNIAREFGVEAIIIKKDGSVTATENINYKLLN